MTQFDAGPGDWSDREWEAPDREPKDQAKRRRVVLPPWALLAIVVAAVILLCLLLVLVVRAIRGGGAQETPTPMPTVTMAALPTATAALPAATAAPARPTATVVLPTEAATEPPAPAEIEPGASVVVTGTGGRGLNLRARPTTQSRRVATVKESTELVVLEGPQAADGFTWWKVKTPAGREGWGAGRWLELKTE